VEKIGIEYDSAMGSRGDLHRLGTHLFEPTENLQLVVSDPSPHGPTKSYSGSTRTPTNAWSSAFNRYQYERDTFGFSVVYVGSLIAISLWVQPIDGR
jgi:hypothetical protein